MKSNGPGGCVLSGLGYDSACVSVVVVESVSARVCHTQQRGRREGRCALNRACEIERDSFSTHWNRDYEQRRITD